MAEPDNNTALPQNKPRLRPLEPGARERHASWLELFFDLVFVLAVAQVAHVLNEHSDFGGALKYLALFVPVWWTWVGFTFYADRFESEETAYRVLMFAGMLAVAALAICLEGAFSAAGDVPFVVCYALARFVIIALYARAAYHIPLVRSFCLQFVVGFGAAAVLWLASLLFEPPARYAFWAIAVALELVTPFLNLRAARTVPFDRSHIPERFGLFTIIVLGEAVIATANGAGKVEWNFSTIAVACLGFAMAAAIWWINFEFVEDGAIKSRRLAPRFVYLYGHFFIVASIVAVGIGVEHAIKETGASPLLKTSTLALLSGGAAVYLAIITVIRLAAGTCRLLFARLAGIAASLSIFAVGLYLPSIFVIGALLLILVTDVWLENRYGVESSTDEEEKPEHFEPCRHADEMRVYQPRIEEGCEECVKNDYKWVHLRLCLSCGHVGCCDSSAHKHATAHFRETSHPIIASLEAEESWAWCYADERFVPVVTPIENRAGETVESNRTK